MQRLRAQTLEIAEDLKSGLMSADRDAKVVRMIDHMIEKGARLKEIKGSDALGAAKLYVDRRWPVRQEQAPPLHLFVNIDLSQFKPDPLDSAQDVTPTTTGGVLAGGNPTEANNLNEFKDANVS